MSAAVFIFGTSHPIQCGSPDCKEEKIRAFEAEVRKEIKERDIRRIVEEMSVDGLAYNNVERTVAERIAQEIGLPYKAVDLSNKERSSISFDDSVLLEAVRSLEIENAGRFRDAFDELSDEVRERIWLAKTMSGALWPTLFICGSNHSVSLSKLWRRLGVQALVITIDYEP